MKTVVAFAVVFTASPLWAQSEEAKRVFNEQLATTWNEVRAQIHEKFLSGIGSLVGNDVAGARVRKAHLVSLNLDSPPVVDALSPEFISLRVPAGQWGLEVKAEVKWEEWIRKKKLFSVTISKTTNVRITVRNLWIGLKILLDARDPERPRVVSVLPGFNYDLHVDSPNFLLGALLRTFSGFVSSVVTKDIARIVLRQYLSDFVAGWPPRVHGTATSLGRTAGTMDFEGAAKRIRVRVLKEQMPHDLVVDAVFENGRRRGFVRQADSAIYTGHWLAAQAIAYKVTRDPEAQRAAMRVLEGIHRALAIGSNPDYLIGSTAAMNSLPPTHQGRLVRYAARADDSIENGKSYRQDFTEKPGSIVPAKIIDGIEWIGYPKAITRDQYAGVMQGLTWALASLDDPRALAMARDAATKIANFVIDNRWIVTDPTGKPTVGFVGQFPHQVALLVMANLADPSRFGSALAKQGALAELIWFNAWIDATDPHGSYFKFDLIHTALSTLLHFDKNAARWPKYQYAQRILWKAVGHHQNPYFAAVAALASPERTRSLGPDVEERLQQWLARPMDDGMPSDIVTPPMYKDVAERSWEKYEPKVGFSFGVGGEVQEEEGGFYSSSVIPLRHRVPRSYLWGRSPFHVGMPKPNPTTVTRFSGTDYQLAYWMARLLGMIAPPPDRTVAPPITAPARPTIAIPVRVSPLATPESANLGNPIIQFDAGSLVRNWKGFLRRFR